MNQIKNFFNPSRLLITWQQPKGSGVGNSRTKYVVAEIYSNEYNDFFRYCYGTKDLEDAIAQGFTGLASFKIVEEPYSGSDILNTFLRRLPPKSRSDFTEYLNTYGLPETFNGTDLTLLAYTGARLPSDSLEIHPDLLTVSTPFEYIFEAAGTRYLDLDLEEFHPEDAVTFECDPGNEFDSNAIKVICSNKVVGFVPRSLNHSLKELVLEKKVTGNIHRIVNDLARPLIYIFIRVD